MFDTSLGVQRLIAGLPQRRADGEAVGAVPPQL